MAGLAITGYKYNLSTSTDNVTYLPYAGSYTTSNWTSGNTFTITGLTNGTYYKVKVKAVNSLGEGAESAEIGPFKPNTVPAPPTAVVGTSNANGQSSVSWVAPTDNGGTAISSYTVQYSTSAIFASAVTTVSPVSSSSPKLVTGLTNGTPYYFRVAATNAGTNGGTGSYSAISAAATPATVPGPPTIGTMTLSTTNTTDSLAWTAPTDNGGSAITGYVYATYDGTTVVEQGTTGNGTTASKNFDPGYTNITTTVKVAAVNSIGTGLYSSFSVVGYGGWTSGGTSISNPDACPAPTCSACTDPDCSGGCGSCAACDGGCDSCGTRSITGAVGSRTATAGTRAASTLGTSSRTCYRWTRGAQATGYTYNQNSTAACSSAYSTCTAGTCGACSAGSCSACSASTCGCSACSSSWVMVDPWTSGDQNNFLGDGVNWYAQAGLGCYGFAPSNNPVCYPGGPLQIWYLYTCSAGGGHRAVNQNECCSPSCC